MPRISGDEDATFCEIKGIQRQEGIVGSIPKLIRRAYSIWLHGIVATMGAAQLGFKCLRDG
jgi:hypothetical protein